MKHAKWRNLSIENLVVGGVACIKLVREQDSYTFPLKGEGSSRTVTFSLKR